jgi:negative regulator of flagellin synthesis FlgM
MNVQNSLDGLKSLLGVNAPTPSAAQATKSSSTASSSGMTSDLATFSSAASEASMAGSEPGVRMDKVAQIQAALASGTYNVPASAVASKLVDSMMGGEQ